ncbi:chloroplast protein TIC236 [Chloropicon primus]|nr:chloroplast protein TIC236 [Chloropicon primus]
MYEGGGTGEETEGGKEGEETEGGKEGEEGDLPRKVEGGKFNWMVGGLGGTLAVVGVTVSLFTAVCNGWARPLVNRAILPVVCEQLSVATGRDVNVEEITWIQPLGLLGLCSLVTAGPIEIGPQNNLMTTTNENGVEEQVAGEQSSLYCEEVKIGVRFLQSILRWQCLLDIKVNSAFAKVVQGENLSWFGYPLDTEPTSRNFLPGLNNVKVLNRLSNNTEIQSSIADELLDEKVSALDPSESELIAKAAAYILSRQFSPPPITLSRLSVKNCNADIQIPGEEGVRKLEDLSAQVNAGRDYNTFDITAAATTVERSAAAGKCTMGWQTDAPRRNMRGLTFAEGSINDILNQGDGKTSYVNMGSTPKPVLERGGGVEKGASAQASTASTSSVASQQSPTKGKGKNNMYRSLFKKKGPSKGRIECVIKGRNMSDPDTKKQMDILLKGKDFHAPLLERVFDFPVDINKGILNGEVRLRFHDHKSWTRYPDFTGRVNCNKANFHIWDAPDDFEDVNMDLLFENDRMHFHNATGYYGAIPVTAVGDMSLDPDGDIRIVAHSDGVEVNALRETLAAKPLPYSAAGTISGTLHVTGQSERPVFSGTAVATYPKGDEPADSPRTVAEEALRETGGVAAYDKVPFESASSVFTFDTKSQMLHLHHFDAETVGGGKITGSGRVWCQPGKEEEPDSLEFRFKGKDLPADQILKKYVPNNIQVPSALVVGPTNVEGFIKGAQMSPTVKVSWNSPEAEASGSVKITRPAAYVELHAPSIDAEAVLDTKYQPKEVILAAVTQDEATAASKPVVEGAELKCKLNGLDIMPLVNDSYVIDRMTSSQPIRLKLSGKTYFHGELVKDSESYSSTFQNLVGEIAMEGLTLNHLSVARQMTGEVTVGKTGLKVQARGLRPDEGIDIDLKLPTELKTADEVVSTEPEQSSRRVSGENPQTDARETEADAVTEDSTTFQTMFSLRNRDVRLEMSMDSTATKVDLRNLRLDELELASLRGTVDKAFIDLNFKEQTGRGNVSVTGPRFSGLQGESLGGSFRWEQDIIRLERAIIQQKRSRYELQGEYVLPTTKDKATLDMATALSQMRNSNLSTISPRGGRWRWQVSVPQAAIEEMLPAAQLLSRATSSYPIDYSNAKGIFLEGVKSLQITAQQIGKQLEDSAKSALESQNRNVEQKESVEMPKAAKNAEGKEKWPKGLPWIGSKTASSKPSTKLGLQDLKGKWKGTMQAYGSTGGAVVGEFDMKGEDWEWGSYCMENVNAVGNYHPNEGLHFEKFQLDAGDARLRIVGNMLGPKQDAQFRLTDFPLSLLQSLFNVLPSNSVTEQGMGSNLFKPTMGPGGLSGMANIPQGDDFISGNLYVNAALGGSAEAPQGNVNFQVLDGALRNKKLARAEANAAITSDQRFTFNINLQPAGGPGHVKLMGSTPFEYSLSPQHLLEGENQQPSLGPKDNENIEVDVAVKDSGMLLLSALLPQVNWQMGSADIAMQVRGTVSKPNLSGVAHVNRASISCPWLSRPLSSLGVTVRVQDNALFVDAFDGKVGRKGFLRINGFLPMSSGGGGVEGSKGVIVDACGLELRVKNAFTGTFDGQFVVRGSLKQPELSGNSQFSKGIVYLVPQGVSQADEPREGMSTATVLKSLGVGSESNLIDKSVKGKMSAVQTSVVNKAVCKGLDIKLGPDLRAVYPFVLNFGIAGDIEINGVVDPEELSPSGIIRFDSGDVNLVATQLSLNPEYPNRAVFVPEHGLDPTLDISLVAPDLKAMIQGRASSWQDNLILSVGSGTSETTERLEPTEIARIFEGQLTESLLEQDGRLAFSNLAASTISTLLPRIETQGQFGKARWRLVSAPSISGLLSLDPLTDPFKSLSNLTLGTEVEIQFGKSLQALIARKVKESEMATHWTLLYQLNKQLRMRLNSSTASGTRLLFEYSGEGTKLQKEDWGNRFP